MKREREGPKNPANSTIQGHRPKTPELTTFGPKSRNTPFSAENAKIPKIPNIPISTSPEPSVSSTRTSDHPKNHPRSHCQPFYFSSTPSRKIALSGPSQTLLRSRPTPQSRPPSVHRSDAPAQTCRHRASRSTLHHDPVFLFRPPDMQLHDRSRLRLHPHLVHP